MTTAQKIQAIREAMLAMPIGNCGSKWDKVVWRISENGWIVGDIGVRRDGYQHSLESVVEWFAWQRQITKGLTVQVGHKVSEVADLSISLASGEFDGGLVYDGKRFIGAVEGSDFVEDRSTECERNRADRVERIGC